jgi:hypothetical protein
VAICSLESPKWRQASCAHFSLGYGRIWRCSPGPLCSAREETIRSSRKLRRPAGRSVNWAKSAPSPPDCNRNGSRSHWDEHPAWKRLLSMLVAAARSGTQRNVVLFCERGNHVDLRGLPGGAEGIRTDGHRGRGEISSYSSLRQVNARRLFAFAILRGKTVYREIPA